MTPDDWTPELQLDVRDDQCRLTLVSVSYGDGPTLQDAANDLTARVYDLARGLRAGGWSASARADPRVSAYLWAISELAIRGGDVRSYVLGGPLPSQRRG